MSAALENLTDALDEVEALLSASPTRAGGAPRQPPVTRAVGRGGIVLLAGHFERYIYAINEETCDVVNAHGCPGSLLHASLRLVHAKAALDEMFPTEWTNRAEQLSAFLRTDGWLWDDERPGALTAARILLWMKTPRAKELVRFYKLWGVADIFASITRIPRRAAELKLEIDGLVDKRNNIAHGDFNEQATTRDVRRYAVAVRTFCQRADRVLGRQLSRLLRISAPW